MKKIIIADDSSLARMFTSRCLSAGGFRNYEVTEAKDGQEVFALLMETTYDLVISDLNMPEMDGVELMTRISQTPQLQSVPVIIITSAGNEDQRKALVTMGAKAILSKPITPSDIAKAVGDLLDAEENGYA